MLNFFTKRGEQVARRIILGIILGGLILFSCFYHSRNNPWENRYSEMQPLMGTTAQVDVCAAGLAKQTREEAYQEVWARLRDISWRMNVFDENSDVAKINNALGKAVVVKKDTYQVLQKAVQFSHLTQGAFDITIWPLMRLWKEGQENNQIPTQERIKEVLKAIGSPNIELLANNQVKLPNPQTKIDLGGIAAGFALDQAAHIFRKHGIQNFYIDIGGDIYAGGKNCAGRPWRIGIRSPQDKSKMIDIVLVSNASITTSGNYEKNFHIQGEQWSHIMDPRTGYPQKEVISATVIAPTGIEADAFATAVCVLGSKEGSDFIDRLGKKYASLVLVPMPDQGLSEYPSIFYEKFRLKK